MGQAPTHHHHAIAWQPVTHLLADEGLDMQACLRGTGILISDFERDDRAITLQQELRFFQNVLAVSGDPLIGLRIGRLYPPQRYGLFGYALLSAPTLRHVMAVTTQFGDYLTFTWLHLGFAVRGDEALFLYSDRYEIPPAIRDFFYDRDLMAGVTAIEEISRRRLPWRRALLPHDGHGRRAEYEQAFGCPVEFGCDGGAMVFPSDLLDTSLPYSDASTSQHLQHQCQLLLERIGGRGKVASEVRRVIVGRPGYFPAIEAVAEKLGYSVRTLRQRLTDEGSGYQKVLDEVRFGLAREYLEQSALPLSEIARLLGYSEPGSFTHVFKKWAQVSPSEYRRRNSAPGGEPGTDR